MLKIDDRAFVPVTMLSKLSKSHTPDYSDINLDYSGINLNYSDINLNYSDINLDYSDINLDYSECLLVRFTL